MDEPIHYKLESMWFGGESDEMYLRTDCEEKCPNIIYRMNAWEECFQDIFEKWKEY